MTQPQQSSSEPPLPIYLGPQLPRWQPSSIADVDTSISDGTLGERHWLDVKREIGSNKELAYDLASFANDGGALLVGIEEDGATMKVTKVSLAGLAEKVDQVARSRCDPPLYVVCHPLRDSPADDQGVLLVEVPPSPLAPHMVDGRYHGRGDKTKHRLSDSEVARLHAVRNSRRQTAEQLIADEIARDPVPVDARKHGHLFVVARPFASPPDLLTEAIEGDSLVTTIRSIQTEVPRAQQFYPHWGDLTRLERRARGLAMHSLGIAGRRMQASPENENVDEQGLLDLEVGDDGRLTLFCGGSAVQRSGERYVNESGSIVLVRGVVTLAGKIGASHGYAGRWLLAVGITSLEGAYSSNAIESYRSGVRSIRFSDNTYVEGTEASTVELLERPAEVTTRLVRRLLRGLGSPAGAVLT